MNDPIQQYLVQEAMRSRAAAGAGAMTGAAGVGASLGAAPGTGGLSLMGLPPSLLAILYGMREHQRSGQMQGGADAFGRTGLPATPHDPGRGHGVGGLLDY